MMQPVSLPRKDKTGRDVRQRLIERGFTVEDGENEKYYLVSRRFRWVGVQEGNRYVIYGTGDTPLASKIKDGTLEYTELPN